MPPAPPPPDAPPDASAASSSPPPASLRPASRVKSPPEPVAVSAAAASFASPRSDPGDPPADLPLPTSSAPPIAPAPTPTVVASVARRMPAAAPRRTQRSRLGRPPNINENSLMRRLECVMAVESGRMTMLTACQQYDISARTFYRWLRNKDRLIELTGFTEDDFRNAPPASWGPDPARQDDQPQQPHQAQHIEPAEEVEPQDNLPRLPAVQRSPAKGTSAASAAGPGASATTAPAAPPPANFMGLKRRFPKGSEAARPSFSGGAASASAERFEGGNSQAAYYARRSFTKMPPANSPAHDGLSAERHAARTSTRMRRQDWPPEPPAQQRFGSDGQFVQAYRESRSNSPHEPFKRRKVIKDAAPSSEEGGDQQGMAANVEQAPETSSPNRHGQEYANGAGYQQGARGPSGGNGQQARTLQPAAQNGGRALESVDGANGKHRIEIMMGRRKVTIAWYQGASAEDIKTSIARRFALLPGTQWALIDKNFDEIVISAGVPSGRYTLTVFS